ncbi:MAG: hypothetical protein HYR66_07295 [Sphingobacteriales bacterium]|nr:hypothetical protein [Sphingobacteriales bacterium]MBI3718183.1 hypothetical protein [Sphingobacteriales bacterium]
MEKKNGPVRALQTLFMALLYGQILFAILAFALVKTGIMEPIEDINTEKVYEVFFLSMAIISALLGFALSKKKTEQAKEIVALKEKFAMYRSACITKYAMIEAAALFCIIFYLLSTKWSFLVAALTLIFLFMSQNPIRQRIKTELLVDDTDVDEMNKSE